MNIESLRIALEHAPENAAQNPDIVGAWVRLECGNDAWVCNRDLARIQARGLNPSVSYVWADQDGPRGVCVTCE